MGAGGGEQAEALAFDPGLRAKAPAAEETDKLIDHGSFQKNVTRLIPRRDSTCSQRILHLLYLCHLEV